MNDLIGTYLEAWNETDPVRRQKLIGEVFAASLDSLAPGAWRGPIASGFGAHLVFVHERTAGRVPPFEEVRDAVRREWTSARRDSAVERLYGKLLARYTVTIEKPESFAGAGGADSGAAKTPAPESRD